MSIPLKGEFYWWAAFEEFSIWLGCQVTGIRPWLEAAVLNVSHHLDFNSTRRFQHCRVYCKMMWNAWILNNNSVCILHLSISKSLHIAFAWNITTVKLIKMTPPVCVSLGFTQQGHFCIVLWYKSHICLRHETVNSRFDYNSGILTAYDSFSLLLTLPVWIWIVDVNSR